MGNITLNDKTLKVLECAVSKDKHITRCAVSLPCGHSACKGCLPYPTGEVKCYECGKTSKADYKDSNPSLAIDYLIIKISMSFFFY